MSVKQEMTQGEQNLALLEKLFPENEVLYIWCYSPEGRCIAASCPQKKKDLLDRAFRAFGGLEKAEKYVKSADRDRPLIIGSPIGMQWALTLEADRSRHLLFVIGPVFYAAPEKAQLETYREGEASASLLKAIRDCESELPVLSYDIFSRYVIMIHNTLTGQRLGTQDLDRGTSGAQGIQLHPARQRDRTRVYLAEQALLEMVKQGNINYHSALERSVSLSPGVPIHGRDPLRQMKTSIVVFITLVSRAAMEGGLSPEVAYSLGDSYIQTVEDCRDSGELDALSHAMYHDFICRVHYLHANPNYSHAVAKCCDYIELSLDRKVRAADLAALVGYTEYYLTEKFRKETGQTVSEYIRRMKIERAKILLRSTSLSIQQISEQLAFNTPNYFIRCFREQMGMTPAAYKKNIRNNISVS